jgi:hypothetical protein
VRWLREWVRAVNPRALAANTRRVDTLASSTKALREDVRGLRRAIEEATTQLDGLQAQLSRLSALRADEAEAGTRMDRLQHVLDADRVAAHANAAINRTTIVEGAAPHALVLDVLPRDVYDALLAAIPRDVFFDRRGTGVSELLIPPRLAPVDSFATWAFVAEAIEARLGPSLIDRLQDQLDRQLAGQRPAFTVSQGRLVLRQPGYQGSRRPNRPWDAVTVILNLARPEDGEEYGSRVDRVEIPFRANSLLVAVDPSGTLDFSPIPEATAATVRRYTCEFRIGLDAEARREVLPHLDEATRRAWEANA